MNFFLQEDMIVSFHQGDKRIFSDIEKGTPFLTRRQVNEPNVVILFHTLLEDCC